ncbi:hypothetical protein [Microbispora sp. H10836]|uniref:hypothetical protein n=1 Tax=Microbispora sp. H10836 TaxID=2729106 RepID=UPI001475A525|nr:hypothetical protein [Microbispora sp. H10836]
MKADDPAERVTIAVGVLIMDLALLMATGFAIDWARDRGVLCDGASVLCSGGDPTFAQWTAEMSFRSTVAYGSYGVMAAILAASLVVAGRRGRRGIVVMQLTALVVVAVLAILWRPYREA